jgi:L-asparaginase II
MSKRNLKEAYLAPEPLVEVTRGSFVESVHRGHLAALDGEGRLVARVGSPEAVTFMRSAAKPFQAVPLVASGAAGRFGLEARELAVACGSHDGERVHTEAVLSVLSKVGLSVADLKCGPQEPYGKEAAERLRARGGRPTALHNNCSGKHAGMLALARHLGAPTENYFEPSHPVQREVFRAVARFAGVPADSLEFAVDGCGVPTFALTVGTMALMFARFVAAGEGFGAEEREAARRIVGAVCAHPLMVEGEGELDTELMRAGGRRFISKVGAEGVYTAGVLPCQEWPRGLGLAFKIEDGDRGDRARPVAAVEALRQLGVTGREETGALAKFARQTVRNRRGEEVGEVRPAFDLRV